MPAPHMYSQGDFNMAKINTEASINQPLNLWKGIWNYKVSNKVPLRWNKRRPGSLRAVLWTPRGIHTNHLIGKAQGKSKGRLKLHCFAGALCLDLLGKNLFQNESQNPKPSTGLQVVTRRVVVCFMKQKLKLLNIVECSLWKSKFLPPAICVGGKGYRYFVPNIIL